eukprot:354859-Chlamydomonas_euryale.AAC.7
MASPCRPACAMTAYSVELHRFGCCVHGTCHRGDGKPCGRQQLLHYLDGGARVQRWLCAEHGRVACRKRHENNELVLHPAWAMTHPAPAAAVLMATCTVLTACPRTLTSARPLKVTRHVGCHGWSFILPSPSPAPSSLTAARHRFALHPSLHPPLHPSSVCPLPIPSSSLTSPPSLPPPPLPLPLPKSHNPLSP